MNRRPQTFLISSLQCYTLYHGKTTTYLSAVAVTDASHMFCLPLPNLAEILPLILTDIESGSNRASINHCTSSHLKFNNFWKVIPPTSQMGSSSLWCISTAPIPKCAPRNLQYWAFLIFFHMLVSNYLNSNCMLSDLIKPRKGRLKPTWAAVRSPL